MLSCNPDSNNVVDAAGTDVQEQHANQMRVAHEHRVGVEHILHAPVVRTWPHVQKREDCERHDEQAPDSLETNDLRVWHMNIVQEPLLCSCLRRLHDLAKDCEE